MDTTIGIHHAIFARNETLDLNRLALFVQVVQSGSFAEASRRMGMPPTTLSRQVAQLEDSLQARLLQRTTRKLTLTDAGRMLFDQCAAQIEVLRSAAQALAGHNQAAVGGLGICLLPVSSLQDGLRSGALVQVLPAVASSVGNLYVVYPSRRHVPRAVTAFVEMAVQRLAALLGATPERAAPAACADR